jgi:hypothetical protein
MLNNIGDMVTLMGSCGFEVTTNATIDFYGHNNSMREFLSPIVPHFGEFIHSQH